MYLHVFRQANAEIEALEEKKAELVNKTALGRDGEPDDIASAAYLLYRSTYMTGQILKIDGGRSPG